MNQGLELTRLPLDSSVLSIEALNYVDDHYGQHPEDNQATLSYHNGLHTRNVMIDFLALADITGLDTASRAIGVAAASSHDLIQGTGRGSDEAKSADWFSENLGKARIFSPFQIEAGRLAILGTEPIFENGLLTGQMAEQIDYPTLLHEKIAKILASADLGRLYTLDGPYMSHMLFKEINGSQEPEDLTGLLKFLKVQMPLLQNYVHPLKEAHKFFSSHQSQVIAYAGSLIQDIELGRLETWQQVVDSDKDFSISF